MCTRSEMVQKENKHLVPPDLSLLTVLASVKGK